MHYTFSAVNSAGETVTGSRDAPDEKSLAKALREEGLLLVAAEAGGEGALKKILSFSIGGTGLVERMTFARNLAVMIGAGLSMTRALEASSEQTKSKRFRAIIDDVRGNVTKGISFTEALGRHRNVFGELFIRMVEAGEISGKLEDSLKLLAKQMKRDHDLHAKVRGAMMYPLVVLVALCGIGTMMLLYVVPTLRDTLEDLNVELPLTTRVVLGVSDFLVNYFYIAILLVAGLIFAVYRFFRTEFGRNLAGRVALKLPILGSLVRKFNAARMARTLSSLISAGMSITRSLDITAGVLGNIKFKNSLKSAIGEIEKGRTFSVILQENKDLYPPLVIQMISVGEETGTLSRMLLRIALFFEEDVDNTTKNLSSIIEPIMMLVIGVIVGFFAISMIQPLYSSLSGI